MIGKRIATVLATLLAVAGGGASGGATTTEARRNEPAAVAAVPAARPQASTRGVVSLAGAGTAVRNVPAAFPLPPGSRVTDLSDLETGASFTLTAPDPAAVLSFYRRHLPLNAFTIVGDRPDADAVSLAFRGTDGWAGAIFATEHRVAVAVKRA